MGDGCGVVGVFGTGVGVPSLLLLELVLVAVHDNGEI